MKSFVTAIIQLQDRLEELLCYVSALAVAAMMLITTLEVVIRAGFYKSVPGSYEYVSLLFVYLIFLGLAFSQRRDAHISIGILYDRLPRKARQITQCIFLLTAFVFFCCNNMDIRRFYLEQLCFGRYSFGGNRGKDLVGSCGGPRRVRLIFTPFSNSIMPFSCDR